MIDTMFGSSKKLLGVTTQMVDPTRLPVADAVVSQYGAITPIQATI